MISKYKPRVAFWLAMLASLGIALPAVAAYNPPKNVRIDYTALTATSARVTWNSGGGTGQNFLLWQSENGADFRFIAFVATSTFSYTFTGLEPNNRYWFRVASGDEIFLLSSAVTVGPVYTKTNMPRAPVITNVSESGLIISIEADGNPASTEYAIQELMTGRYVYPNGKLQGGGEYRTRSAWNLPVNVIDLNPNTTYTWRVIARNSDNAVAYSPVVNSVTLATVPTNVDGFLTSSGNIAVSWQGNGSAYLVDTADMPSSDWITGTSFTFPASFTRCNTSYSIHVKARNSAGVETAYSPIITVATQPCPKPPPPPPPKPTPTPKPAPIPTPSPGGQVTTSPPVTTPPVILPASSTVTTTAGTTNNDWLWMLIIGLIAGAGVGYGVYAWQQGHWSGRLRQT